MPDLSPAARPAFSPPPDAGCPGLIAALRLPGDGGAPEALDAAAAGAALAAGETGLWLHLDLVDQRARALLAGLPGLPPAARAVLVEAEESTVRLELEQGVLFGAIPDIHYEATWPSAESIGLLHLALLDGPGPLLTARRHPLRGVHRALAASAGLGSPVAALAAVLRESLGALAQALQALGQRLDRVEEALLRGGLPEVRRDELAAIRREALRLSRYYQPLAEQATALAEEQEDSPLLRGAPALRREVRRAESLRHGLALLQERARIAQDQLASLAAEATNRRLFALSVISAAMLPASLVAGIFGMNVGGLPGVESDSGFAMAMGLILASIGGILAALRLGRML